MTQAVASQHDFFFSIHEEGSHTPYQDISKWSVRFVLVIDIFPFFMPFLCDVSFFSLDVIDPGKGHI